MITITADTTFKDALNMMPKQTCKKCKKGFYAIFLTYDTPDKLTPWFPDMKMECPVCANGRY